MSDENEARREARERWEKAYNRAKDKWPAGQVKTWEEFDDFLGLIAPPEGTPEWNGHSLLRHLHKRIINERAASRRQNWRILINRFGESVVKLEDSDLVNNEAPARWKKIAEYLDRAKRVFNELLEIPQLDNTDRKLLQSSSNTFEGTRMMMKGAVSQMRGISAPIKKEILEYLDATETDEE